jgi:ankyrin repeat protein
VIAACLLWKPLQVKWYAAKLKSKSVDERMKGMEKLINLGERGTQELAEKFPDGKNAGKLLVENLDGLDKALPRNPELRFLLHVAALNDCPDLSRFLLKKGCVADVRDRLRRTPLHFASSKGHVGIIGILLKNGANVNAEDEGGWTPLQFAIFDKQKGAVEFLVENGADLSLGEPGAFTALHLAVYHDRKSIVKYLINEGSDIDKEISRNFWWQGYTPLHFAAGKRYEEVASLLMEKGANPNALNSEEKTPLDLALAGKYYSIAKLLIKGGGKMGVELKAPKEKKKNK